jgi:DNA-binding transcriptional LysR family regulator
VVDRFDEAVETMRRVKQGTVRTLRVGVFPGPLRSVVPPALVELRTELPEVVVETRFIATDDQLRALLEARLELALLPSLGEFHVPAPLRTQVVQREPLGIAVPAAHPTTNQSVLGTNDLLQLPLVFMSRDGAADVYETVMASLRGAGVQPRSVLESSSRRRRRPVHRSTRGARPATSRSTSDRVAIDVSPGVVIASAPCATP